MVKKLQKLSSEKSAGSHLASTVKDSAQQIWLAGLGAFAKAQDEGSKVFDALVKEGLTMQRKTQSAAEEKISEATSRVSSMAQEISAKASEMGAKATGQWDKLENIFEDRVAKVLKKMGVPAATDIDGLLRRIDDLQALVAKLSEGAAEGAKAVVKSVAKIATPAAKPAPLKAKAAPRRAAAKASAKVAAKPAVKPTLKAVPKVAAKAEASVPAPAKTKARPARKTAASPVQAAA